MVRHQSLSGPPYLLWAIAVWLGLPGPILAQAPEPRRPGRVFAASTFSIDEILSRPFDRDVPMGCTGDRLWASSPQGWAFRDDVQWLYLTDLRAFDLEIRDEYGLLRPAKATYFPSHIHFEGAVRQEMTAAASFTFALDRVENPLSAPFKPEKRWTCWSSGKRGDWFEVDLGVPRKISGFDLFFFDDSPSGECRAPASFEVQTIDHQNAAWNTITPTRVIPERPGPGENRVRFEPVVASRFRFQFRHAGERFYTGLYGVRPLRDAGESMPTETSPLEISGDKFITKSDILVSIVRVHNPTSEVQTMYVDPTVDLGTPLEYWDVKTGSGLIVREDGEVTGREPRSLSLEGRKPLLGRPLAFRFRYAVLDDPPRPLKIAGASQGRTASFAGFARPMLAQGSSLYRLFGHHVQPGKTKVFKAAFEIRPDNEPARIGSVLKPATDRTLLIKAEDQDTRDLLATQIKDHQSWFDSNLAYFDCSDPFIRKMYYHRAYVLRKNMLDPKLGRMQWPTQSEGRWRSTWYPNVISYGAAHQVREARWLRDPAYWQGHLRTWAENEKSGGVYPSHVLPSGPAGGQYTDWITSTAWEGQLVHPDARFLAAVVDKLAANVRGWQKEYDPDGDGLLLVDSHWWTGMEYQPSFFFFSNFKVSRDFGQPAAQVSLERVDLTAYNYGNAVAVARIYRKLGHPEKADEFDRLAGRIRSAVLAKMWRPEDRFFFSLRASDKAVAGVKEVIGVYPFYFGMVPSGEGYESAWSSIIDPEQFWTKWPVASASRECPAFSQKNWPNDGRAAGCMWNGPTWPHANSLVMTAMARTLRATRDHKVASSPLKREHLWELFTSFTKAQFRKQDLLYPWTGEFYNGDTGEWKTAERDYNHSTWLDVLIPDMLGLVPRDDKVIELDPLVPEGRLSYFILDGQRYRGHDVTIVWDAPLPGSEDHFADGRKGLDLYVDGKLVASSPKLARLEAPL
jgi:Mannosylglycerate hydrolase MGH1-like glycoside hydrolase domain/NedA-like, galactose-binding domain